MSDNQGGPELQAPGSRLQAPWNPGFPEIVKRGGNEIEFEVLGPNEQIQKAYVLGAGIWTNSSSFDVIPNDSVFGWREPALKTCRFGNHPIDEVTDRGCITFYEVKNGETTKEEYACRACELDDRIATFARTRIITTNLWVEAALQQQRRDFLLEFLDGDRVERFDQFREGVLHFARRRLRQERAFDPKAAKALVQPIEALLRYDFEMFDGRPAGSPAPLITLAGDLLRPGGIRPRRFWFDHLMADMESVTVYAKAWEQQVWFGGAGEAWGTDPKYTEPYPGVGDMGFRQYLQKPAGHGTHFSTRPDVLPPNSLQAFVIKADRKGYSAKVGDLSYTSYSMAGRSIFQIEQVSSGDYVSMILDETSPLPRGGIRSLSAKAGIAAALLQRAIFDWNSGAIVLERNDGVGLL